MKYDRTEKSLPFKGIFLSRTTVTIVTRIDILFWKDQGAIHEMKVKTKRINIQIVFHIILNFMAI